MQNRCLWPKIRSLQGVIFLEVFRENPFPCLLQLLEACTPGSTPSFKFKAIRETLSNLWLWLFHLLRTLCYTGPTQRIQDSLFILRSPVRNPNPIGIPRSPSACNLTLLMSFSDLDVRPFCLPYHFNCTYPEQHSVFPPKLTFLWCSVF